MPMNLTLYTMYVSAHRFRLEAYVLPMSKNYLIPKVCIVLVSCPDVSTLFHVDVGIESCHQFRLKAEVGL